MRIGLFLPVTNPHYTPDLIALAGRGAEARGFHSLWLAEHVVLFDDYASQYPYTSDGRIPVSDEEGILEPIGTLSFLAAETETIRLGTGICLVPQRNPVYTAKEVANLDWLSGGRVDFGVGVGWLKEEYDAVDVDFERRGARCRAYLEVMRRLWCDAISEYQGEFYTLPPCRQYPKPIQKPHPPIHFGGESEAALRRVADLGQGWYGFNLDPDGVAEGMARLQVLLDERGRKREELLITTCPYTRKFEPNMLGRYREAGVDQLNLLLLARNRDELERRLDQLAETVVEPARAL
jgi:probable F420-dependent oxidoreductase